MKRSLLFILRLLSFLPALFLLCLIFGFSAQNGEDSDSLSFQISLFIVQLISPLLPTAATDDILFARAEAIHLFVRKAAHMTEYFLLTLSLHLPLYVYLKQKLSFKMRLFFCLPAAIAFAALDEFHQSFVDGRSGNLFDVGIDSVGILLATVFLVIITKIKRKRVKP